MSRSRASGAAAVDAAAPELCSARYVAQQIGGHVVLYAMGAHQGSGCVVFFRREPGEQFPPRFSLWHVRGTPPQLQVLTPFVASASFQTTRRVDHVAIVDVHGAREVTVDTVTSAKVVHAV